MRAVALDRAVEDPAGRERHIVAGRGRRRREVRRVRRGLGVGLGDRDGTELGC